MANNTQIIPHIKGIIPKDAKSVLCIGCGHHNSSFFKNESMRKNHDILETCFSSFDITGIDIFPKAIEYRNTFGPKGTYISGDTRDIRSLVTSKFDVVICHHVIEHLPKEDGWKLIEDCESLSKNIVIFGAPTGFVKSNSKDNEYMEHLSGWTPKEFSGYNIDFNKKGIFLVSKRINNEAL